MINKYSPNVKATISFLKFLDIKVNNSTVDDTLQNHPDWPSLLCVSDSLNLWNIPNAAGKIEVFEIDQLPIPFMAYTSHVENPLEIVTAVSEKEVTLYSTRNNKQVIESKDSFYKRWKGIYLIAEKNEKSGEKDFKSNQKKAFIQRLIPISLFILLPIITLLFLTQSLMSSETANYFPFYFQYFVLVLGVFVSSLLLWYEIDNDNPLLHKVCTGIVKGNCAAILSSKQSKVLSWLSWSEVGFFYFAGGLLTLLFISPISSSILVVGFLNILALPYTIFSVYYQSSVAKQWCVLCLSVQVLLVLGGINVIINGLLLSVLQVSINLFIKSALLYLFPVIFWYAVKPYILRLQEAKNEKREYLRIKFNPQIFETLLEKQKQIAFPIDGIGIDFGNPKATNTLVKVCNPFCEPCSKAHPKIERLLEEIPNLKVKVIFTIPNHPDHDAFNPVNHLLIIQDQNRSDEIIKHALNDWYLADKKNYESFAIKYPIIGNFEKQGGKIDAMFNWCNSMEIQYTPTIFINGYQLPESYNIEDLQYFLLE